MGAVLALSKDAPLSMDKLCEQRYPKYLTAISGFMKEIDLVKNKKLPYRWGEVLFLTLYCLVQTSRDAKLACDRTETVLTTADHHPYIQKIESIA